MSFFLPLWNDWSYHLLCSKNLCFIISLISQRLGGLNKILSNRIFRPRGFDLNALFHKLSNWIILFCRSFLESFVKHTIIPYINFRLFPNLIARCNFTICFWKYSQSFLFLVKKLFFAAPLFIYEFTSL